MEYTFNRTLALYSLNRDIIYYHNLIDFNTESGRSKEVTDAIGKLTKCKKKLKRTYYYSPHHFSTSSDILTSEEIDYNE